MSMRSDFMDGMQDALGKGGERLRAALTDEVDSRGITNRGRLRQGFELQLAVSGTDAVMQITGVRYANYVAEGTPSGYRPPFEPIKRWVETKLNPPENKVFPSVQTIRENIQQHGTPTPNSPLTDGRNDYVKGALEQELPNVLDLMEERIASAMN